METESWNRDEQVGQMFRAATSDGEKQGAVTLYQGLRIIDYGLTFDVCLFTGWILLFALGTSR